MEPPINADEGDKKIEEYSSADFADNADWESKHQEGRKKKVTTDFTDYTDVTNSEEEFIHEGHGVARRPLLGAQFIAPQNIHPQISQITQIQDNNFPRAL